MFDDTERSYSQASSNCESLDATLVVITSESENTFIANMRPNSDKRYWIGLGPVSGVSYSGWVDGTPLDYENWAPNEPSGNQMFFMANCGEMIPNSDTWNDARCDKSDRMSICEMSGMGGRRVLVGQHTNSRRIKRIQKM